MSLTLRAQRANTSGFTLLELVITMVFVGILAAVTVTRISALAQHSVTVQADVFRRDLSHIQLLATSNGSRLRLLVNSGGTNYSVVTCTTSACTTTATLTDPATGANFNVNLTDNVKLTPVSSTLDFDSLGRPQAGGSLITTARSFTLSGSGNCVDVSVRPITGFASSGLPYAC